MALAVLASFMITCCSVMGATAGYLLWEVIDNPHSLGLYGDLLDPVEASGHLPAVGPHFGNERPGLVTVSSMQSGPRTNILLLGLDQRGEVQHRAFRTDTIMIASLNPKTKEAMLFSIPRDLYVEVPERGKRRIDIVHVLGETQGYPGGGPALLMETIQQDFGIPLDGYVMVNFQGFSEVVDLLGGVDIYVEKEIWDNRYADDRLGEPSEVVRARVERALCSMALR